jgi:hypothetical protein
MHANEHEKEQKEKKKKKKKLAMVLRSFIYFSDMVSFV